MTRLISAAALVAVLAACSSTAAPEAGALLKEPSSVAVFRGVTIKSGLDPSASPPYRPYIAVANAGSDDLTILDGVDDSVLPAPALLRGLVYPIPGRPVLVAAADLGDGKPDLLVVLTAGDLPWLGGSRLQVVRTWAPDGAVVGSVDLGADVLALAVLASDAPGSVKIVAALAGERVALVTFSRSTAGDGTAIDPALATTAVSAPLGFQPVDLAVIPGDTSRVFAASLDPLPGGIHGVAELDLTGSAPAFSAALDAHAPTRLVGVAHLAEAIPLSTALDQAAFVGQTPVDRVYAVLDESGCGLLASIACGLVAIDPVTRDLLPDPTPAGTMHAPFRAPIPVVGSAVALGVMGPPKEPPSAAEPQYAGTYVRIAAGSGARQTTAIGGLAATDGALTIVDLARWDVPNQQAIHANLRATVTPTRPEGTAGAQWLVLEAPGGGTVSHLDAVGLTTSVGGTAGYTPSDTWTVTREGLLPNLLLRRAEAGNDGAPWLALQQTAPGGSVQAAVRLWDPTLGVRAGDTVVIDPTGLGSCGEFEATVADVAPPDATRPGGYVHLTHRTFSPGTPVVPPATLAKWNACVDIIPVGAPPGSGPFFAATFRAGGYVLVRGAGSSLVHVGRPELGQAFSVAWQDETALASACPLPPSVPWPSTPPACDATCREGCELLQRVRLARRVGYVVEPPSDLTGPALTFTLALEEPSVAVPRNVALVIATTEGRLPYRAAPNVGVPLDPRAVVPFDRSPWSAVAGVRFFVPYASGDVLDMSPTLENGLGNTIH